METRHFFKFSLEVSLDRTLTKMIKKSTPPYQLTATPRCKLKKSITVMSPAHECYGKHPLRAIKKKGGVSTPCERQIPLSLHFFILTRTLHALYGELQR